MPVAMTACYLAVISLKPLPAFPRSLPFPRSRSIPTPFSSCRYPSYSSSREALFPARIYHSSEAWIKWIPCLLHHASSASVRSVSRYFLGIFLAKRFQWIKTFPVFRKSYRNYRNALKHRCISGKLLEGCISSSSPSFTPLHSTICPFMVIPAL